MFSRDQVLDLMRERVHHPAGMRELLQILKVPREERTTFKRHVKSLVSSGDLIQIRGHRFGLPEKMDLYVGRLQTHPAGYGFVTPERPLENGGDVYIKFLFGLFVMSVFFGFVGLLLAVPLVAALQILTRELWTTRMDELGVDHAGPEVQRPLALEPDRVEVPLLLARAAAG